MSSLIHNAMSGHEDEDDRFHQTLFTSHSSYVSTASPRTSAGRPISRGGSIQSPPSILSQGSSGNNSPSVNSSRNLQQASVNPSQPFSIPLRNSSAATSKRTRMNDALTLSLSSTSVTEVEKDADDPTTPLTRRSRDYTSTPTRLNKLLGGEAPTPPSSRNPSYNMSGPPVRNLCSDVAGLPDHLYTRGLLGGRHSDITLIVFKNRYPLHRLILDRAPFFTNALSEPWLESASREVTLYPEEIDSNITRPAFEIALKRLYGGDISAELDSEAVGLFATACWLEMQDLIDASIDSILRQLHPKNLASYIKLVTNNYYGRAGERILSSAKAMLCRDGWQMQLKYWDGIPADIIREIIGGDGFFINGEWDRWLLSVRVLDRHLKHVAAELDILELGQKTKIKAPNTLRLVNFRFSPGQRRSFLAKLDPSSDSPYLTQWFNLYSHQDIEPLIVLLDEGIHYIHLDFEQLQAIRRTRDIFGLPLTSENVISNALWMSVELRQKVMSARETDYELGLSNFIEQPSMPQSRRASSDSNSTTVLTPTTESSSFSKAKQLLNDNSYPEQEQEQDEDVWFDNAMGTPNPRKFWIPSADCNIVMGGTTSPLPSASSMGVSRPSTLQNEDNQWAGDFTSVRTSSSSHRSSVGSNSNEYVPVTYTNFPPFRFSAEFPHPRTLKERKRVYSRTIFYAGSYWNIYIQKVKSLKGVQLGVYLHRAKERETESAGSGNSGAIPRSVDERIGHLERQMTQRTQSQRTIRRAAGDIGMSDNVEEDTNNSSGDGETTLVGSSPSPRRSSHPHLETSSSPYASVSGGMVDSDSDSSLEHTSYTSFSDLTSRRRDHSQPQPPQPTTLPSYVDARPTIKTYFKIYSPSKGGRLLSIYESAPDRFNFSQSWGWKSSTLMLDEGLEDEEKKGGKLRFMVVIGNL